MAKLVVGLATNSLSRSLQDALSRRLTAKRLAAEDGYLVSIPGDATVDRLRHTWAEAAPRWRSEQRACLDLTDCTFSDVAGPAYLISKMVERHRLGLITRVRLPEQPEIISFLREINFLEAMTVATETSLPQLLTTQSLYRLTRVESGLNRPAVNRRPTLPFNIFPFKVLQLGSSTRHAPAVRYAADWLSKHVVAALDRDLAGHGAQVARLVILETLIRASIGHDKRTAVVAAHYGLRHADRGYLQIAFWWDEAGDRSTQVATAELLELMFQRPQEVLAALPNTTPAALRDAWQLPSNPTVLASAVIDIFGGQLDAYAADTHLALVCDRREGSDVPALPPTLTFDQSNGGAVLGDLVVVTLPLND
ncbi:hypothetical protein ACGFJ4_11710 [Micromonospora chalcea]|uniref:hypothetical protein n=1 Tax=Micromonospora chalcea TaxID=1874 RepID=UPI00371B91D6